ncbi:MAG: hypothetical protein WAO19_02180 [Candidatus Kryptoniota bacterium]
MTRYFLLLVILSGCASRGIDYDYSNAVTIAIDQNALTSFISTIKHISKAQEDSFVSDKNGKVYPNPFSPTLSWYFTIRRDSCPVSVSLTSLDSLHSAKLFEGTLNKGIYKMYFPNQDSICWVAYITIKADTTRSWRVIYVGE